MFRKGESIINDTQMTDLVVVSATESNMADANNIANILPLSFDDFMNILVTLYLKESP